MATGFSTALTCSCFQTNLCFLPITSRPDIKVALLTLTEWNSTWKRFGYHLLLKKRGSYLHEKVNLLPDLIKVLHTTTSLHSGKNNVSVLCKTLGFHQSNRSSEVWTNSCCVTEHLHVTLKPNHRRNPQKHYQPPPAALLLHHDAYGAWR